MRTETLSPVRLQRAKAAYTTRHVELDAARTLLTGALQPRSGDLVLAQVSEIGHHRLLETRTSRKANLFVGDEILISYGNRYAPDQFEAEVPFDLSACHLVAAGGVAAQVLSQHTRMNPPTSITPLGLLGDHAGRRLNLRDWAFSAPPVKGPRPRTYAVVGNSMNSGKTTTAANLIHGLTAAGLRVGAAKITGTGAGGDPGLFADAGAAVVYDFTHAGFPSTYRATPLEVRRIFETLTGSLAAQDVDTIVLEIADGIFQEETRELVVSTTFRKGVDGVLFAAADALSAAYGVKWFSERTLPLLAVSGLLTASPLARREAELASQAPVLDMLTLQAATITEWLAEPCANPKAQAVAC